MVLISKFHVSKALEAAENTSTVVRGKKLSTGLALTDPVLRHICSDTGEELLHFIPHDASMIILTQFSNL